MLLIPVIAVTAQLRRLSLRTPRLTASASSQPVSTTGLPRPEGRLVVCEQSENGKGSCYREVNGQPGMDLVDPAWDLVDPTGHTPGAYMQIGCRSGFRL